MKLSVRARCRRVYASPAVSRGMALKGTWRDSAGACKGEYVFGFYLL